MADGKNEARALRILEIINDSRTLEVHIRSITTRGDANPPDQQSASLVGYALIRQCASEQQALIATPYNPGTGQPGSIPATEEQKANLQRIILDASSRRFRAHKIYLRASAAIRWIQMRRQVLSGGAGRSGSPQALQQIDQRLREEIQQITDDKVYSDLRNTDRRKGFWIDDDPSLERILAWIRTQR